MVDAIAKVTLQEVPIRQEGRYFFAQQFSYTSVGTGALEITCSPLVQDKHPFWLYHLEIDTTGSVPSANYELFLEWPVGDTYNGLSFRLGSWSGTAADHYEPVLYNRHPIPPNALFRLTCSASAVDEEFKIHYLGVLV